MGEDIAYTSTRLHDFHRVTPSSSRPGFGRQAGQPTCLIIPQTPNRCTRDPKNSCTGTPSCHHRLTAALSLPAGAHLGLLAVRGPPCSLWCIHSSALLPLSFRGFLPVFVWLLWTLCLVVASMPCNRTAWVGFVLKGLKMSFREWLERATQHRTACVGFAPKGLVRRLMSQGTAWECNLAERWWRASRHLHCCR